MYGKDGAFGGIKALIATDEPSEAARKLAAQIVAEQWSEEQIAQALAAFVKQEVARAFDAAVGKWDFL